MRAWSHLQRADLLAGTLGDATMAIVRAGGAVVSIKCPMNFRTEIGTTFEAEITADAVHLLDSTIGIRVERGVVAARRRAA